MTDAVELKGCEPVKVTFCQDLVTPHKVIVPLEFTRAHKRQWQTLITDAITEAHHVHVRLLQHEAQVENEALLVPCEIEVIDEGLSIARGLGKMPQQTCDGLCIFCGARITTLTLSRLAPEAERHRSSCLWYRSWRLVG